MNTQALMRPTELLLNIVHQMGENHGKALHSIMERSKQFADFQHAIDAINAIKGCSAYLKCSVDDDEHTLSIITTGTVSPAVASELMAGLGWEFKERLDYPEYRIRVMLFNKNKSDIRILIEFTPEEVTP
jgi:hypothetical protein